MASLKKGIEFTGMSVYTMKGSDKIIVRKKGGPKREDVLEAKNFERSRENATEFSGVNMAVSAIRMPLLAVKHLADYNFTSTLTNICKKIQVEDKTGGRGQRCVFLSQQRHMLAGFRLNKKHPFTGIVAGPVHCMFNRETKSAVIQLPQLVPGLNLHLPWKQPYYRFSLSLGLVPDIVYENGQYHYHVEDRAEKSLDTAWQEATDTFQPQTLELKPDKPGAMKDSQTMICAIGIEMGTPGPNGEITPVKYGGSACILALG